MKDLFRITDKEAEEYAEAEARETALDLADIEWDYDNYSLAGLIVDTRDWLYLDIYDMDCMNAFIPRAQWADYNHENNAIRKLETNRHISASNFRRGI